MLEIPDQQERFVADRRRAGPHGSALSRKECRVVLCKWHRALFDLRAFTRDHRSIQAGIKPGAPVSRGGGACRALPTIARAILLTQVKDSWPSSTLREAFAPLCATIRPSQREYRAAARSIRRGMTSVVALDKCVIDSQAKAGALVDETGDGSGSRMTAKFCGEASTAHRSNTEVGALAAATTSE